MALIASETPTNDVSFFYCYLHLYSPQPLSLSLALECFKHKLPLHCEEFHSRVRTRGLSPPQVAVLFVLVLIAPSAVFVKQNVARQVFS